MAAFVANKACAFQESGTARSLPGVASVTDFFRWTQFERLPGTKTGSTLGVSNWPQECPLALKNFPIS
jgi:hypothetical protein